MPYMPRQVGMALMRPGPPKPVASKRWWHPNRVRPQIRRGRSFHSVAFLCFLCLLTGCAVPKEDLSPVFYPSLPETPRLQFLTAISSEEDLESSRSDFENFLLGPEIVFATLGRPYDVSTTPGKIYIVDRQFNKLVRIDLVTGNFDIVGTGLTNVIQAPAGITIDTEGRKYIADMTRKEIVVLDADDNFLKTYGGSNILEKPVDVAVWHDKIHVADIKLNRIVVFDLKSGQLMGTIGASGNRDGEFYKPSHIVSDEVGNLFVNDTFNFRVQKFSADGRFERKFGFHGDLIGAMARSKGIAVDHAGNLYVADAAFEYVQIFDGQGKLLLFFGGPGNKRGNLYLPAGIHIDYDNIDYFAKFADDRFKIEYLLYVCNMSGPNKINVYGFGQWLGE